MKNIVFDKVYYDNNISARERLNLIDIYNHDKMRKLVDAIGYNFKWRVEKYTDSLTNVTWRKNER